MRPKTDDETLAYEPPAFIRQDLRVITLGGTPGAGDSGAPTTENEFGGGTGGRTESFEEGWEDEDDGKP